MTARGMLPVLLIAALAVACSDSTAPETDLPSTNNPVKAAGVVPLLGAKDGVAALDPGCASVVGTFYGQHLKPPEVSAKGWYGTLYLSIAGGTVETPGFWDRGNGTHRTNAASGVFGGEETNTITFSPGNSFDIDASYNAEPTGTPGLFVLHETGSLTNGSGDYAGVSGHVAVDGPFTHPSVGDIPPQFIAEMHGSICGLP